MNSSIDNKVLSSIKELYANDDRAQKFFDWASARTNDAAETSIGRISQVTGIARSEANDLAKILTDAGCGEYIVGRKGWKTRIRWSFSLRSLGKAATGTSSELEQVDPDLVEDASDQTPSAPPSISGNGPSKLTIADAKNLLARALGVSADKIEITIRA